jgi:hypothetical protein
MTVTLTVTLIFEFKIMLYVASDRRTSTSKGKARRAKDAVPMRGSQKTVYLGKGLGFKHNDRLDSELHSILNIGSAKKLLQQILNDEEDS